MAHKILLVDDDKLNITLIKFGLKQQEYDVETAEDGRDALDKTKSFQPDLIILDIQMPKMSGYEFLTELKVIPDAKDIPIIVLTANENMQDIFSMEGVKDYLVKPVNVNQLKEKIISYLGN